AWRSNPFFYAAFKFAVAKLLEALTPPGQIIAPKLADGILYSFLDHEIYKSPERLASQTAGAVLLFLAQISNWSPEERQEKRRLLDELVEQDDLPLAEEQLYSIQEAVHDLSVNPKFSGQWKYIRKPRDKTE